MSMRESSSGLAGNPFTCGSGVGLLPFSSFSSKACLANSVSLEVSVSLTTSAEEVVFICLLEGLRKRSWMDVNETLLKEGGSSQGRADGSRNFQCNWALGPWWRHVFRSVPCWLRCFSGVELQDDTEEKHAQFFPFLHYSEGERSIHSCVFKLRALKSLHLQQN